ncbi:MAG: hypothetical protein WCF23_12430 [Candidatus Nitrosopolaris sp.]
MIQCGGYGNLPPLKQITEIKFREFFKNCEEPWHFAKAEEKTDLLAKTGFKNIDVALSNECAKLVEHTIYSSFMKNRSNVFLGLSHNL